MSDELRDERSDRMLALVVSVEQGQWLDLLDGASVGQGDMRQWGEPHEISSDLIRSTIRGVIAKNSDPHGLRIRGARIVGHLDLENVKTDLAVTLQSCYIPDGINLRGARLAELNIERCLLEHPNDPPLAADELWTSGTLSLAGTTVQANTSGGAVSIASGHIGGRLDLHGAIVCNEGGIAINATEITVERTTELCDGFQAVGSSERGAVRLVHARLSGTLNCTRATIRNNQGPALRAGGASIANAVWLSDGFHATGAHNDGAVCFDGATIGGRLDLGSATIINSSGPAFSAHRAVIDGPAWFKTGFVAEGAGPDGTLALIGAHIRSDLMLSGASISNATGPAIAADGMIVDRDINLDEGFKATSCHAGGVVILTGAHIGADFYCDDATIHNAVMTTDTTETAAPGETAALVAAQDVSNIVKGALDISNVQIVGMAGFSGTRIDNALGDWC